MQLKNNYTWEWWDFRWFQRRKLNQKQWTDGMCRVNFLWIQTFICTGLYSKEKLFVKFTNADKVEKNQRKNLPCIEFFARNRFCILFLTHTTNFTIIIFRFENMESKVVETRIKNRSWAIWLLCLLFWRLLISIASNQWFLSRPLECQNLSPPTHTLFFNLWWPYYYENHLVI